MRALAALSDPTRQRIVELLAERELSAGEVAAHFRISRPAVSRHLRVLRTSGVARARSEAQRRVYSLNFSSLAEIDAWLARYRQFWTRRLDQLEQAVEDTHERSKRSTARAGHRRRRHSV